MKVIVDLKFDLNLYCSVKVNRIVHNYDFHGDLKYFINKQKKRGEVCTVLIYPKFFSRNILQNRRSV